MKVVDDGDDDDVVNVCKSCPQTLREIGFCAVHLVHELHKLVRPAILEGLNGNIDESILAYFN
jgi:hypothetical protein